jgi:hypothetical protein
VDDRQAEVAQLEHLQLGQVGLQFGQVGLAAAALVCSLKYGVVVMVCSLEIEWINMDT